MRKRLSLIFTLAALAACSIADSVAPESRTTPPEVATVDSMITTGSIADLAEWVRETNALLASLDIKSASLRESYLVEQLNGTVAAVNIAPLAGR